MASDSEFLNGFCRVVELDENVFKHYILGNAMPCFVEFGAPLMLYATFMIFCIYRIHQLLARKDKVRIAIATTRKIILSPLSASDHLLTTVLTQCLRARHGFLTLCTFVRPPFGSIFSLLRE